MAALRGSKNYESGFQIVNEMEPQRKHVRPVWLNSIHRTVCDETPSSTLHANRNTQTQSTGRPSANRPGEFGVLQVGKHYKDQVMRCSLAALVLTDDLGRVQRAYEWFPLGSGPSARLTGNITEWVRAMAASSSPDGFPASWLRCTAWKLATRKARTILQWSAESSMGNGRPGHSSA